MSCESCALTVRLEPSLVSGQLQCRLGGHQAAAVPSKPLRTSVLCSPPYELPPSANSETIQGFDIIEFQSFCLTGFRQHHPARPLYRSSSEDLVGRFASPGKERASSVIHRLLSPVLLLFLAHPFDSKEGCGLAWGRGVLAAPRHCASHGARTHRPRRRSAELSGISRCKIIRMVSWDL